MVNGAAKIRGLKGMNSNSAFNHIVPNCTPIIIESVIAQHAEEAAFLWLLRDNAVRAPHYRLKTLARLDDRVEAHLDGLRIAGDDGWPVCLDVWSLEDEGELFAFSEIAFESGDKNKIDAALEAAVAEPGPSSGAISALGWLPWQQAELHVAGLLADGSPLWRHVGLAASAEHRHDPGRALDDALNASDPALRARALRAAGELGRVDLLGAIWAHLNDDDDLCRYSAAWSAALLGDEHVPNILKGFVRSEYPWRHEALQLAMRRMSHAVALEWQAERSKEPALHRSAVTAAGIIGDPVLIPWLIDKMTIPEFVRVAGESFSMITGVDIAYEDLEGEWPEGFEAGPTENPEDEDVEMDPDEDLPWPNHDLISAWWDNNRGRFKAGTRYLCGQPITENHLQYVLCYGYQRQRYAAALELSMMNPGQPLFNVCAPAWRQKQLLGLK